MAQVVALPLKNSKEVFTVLPKSLQKQLFQQLITLYGRSHLESSGQHFLAGRHLEGLLISKGMLKTTRSASRGDVLKQLTRLPFGTRGNAGMPTGHAGSQKCQIPRISSIAIYYSTQVMMATEWI